MARVTEGLEPQFGLMTPVKGRLTFEQVYSLEARLLALQNHLRLHLLLDVFAIRTILDGTGNIVGNGQPTSLFLNYSNITT